MERAHKKISLKIAKNIGIISRISYLLPINILINLYYALVYPYFSYCNLVWASNYNSRLNKLVVLQKRAVRILAKIPIAGHSKPYFQLYNILTIDQIKKLQIGDFMYRLEHGLLPCIFSNYLHKSANFHSYNTRTHVLYRCEYARTIF